MSNVYDIDHKRRRAEQRAVEASTWIAKMDQGLGDAEAEALRAWMRADPENQAELLEMARMWDRMDALARLSEVFPHASEASHTAAYETAVGGTSTIELSDRSEITLNTDSRAVVRFAQGQRIVNLERGEMHIDVAQDPARPVSVIAGGHVVRAVGTAFTVRVDASRRVELLVVDGRVRVHAHEPGAAGLTRPGSPDRLGDRSLLVTEGERVVLNADRETVEALEPEEIDVRLSWRNGNLVFRGESLADAVAEVSRYTTVDFVIPDDDLRKLRVAGLFKADDVAGFLATLRANFDIVSERADARTIVLSAREHPTRDVSR